MQRIVLFLILFSSLGLFAHPVSYKDAVGIMSYNTSKMNEILLTYSLNPKFAVATTYLRDSESEFYIPRINFLLKRWNNDDSQANIYLSAGAGYEKFNSNNYSVRLGEVIIDWESRKYYTYFEHLYLRRDNDQNNLIPNKDYNHTKARIGFAPFLADYSELNVWLILQTEKHNNESIQSTQFLRFFMKNVLWEIGAGFDGSMAFNFMIHI